MMLQYSLSPPTNS